MGLDMYLFKDYYIGGKYAKDSDKTIEIDSTAIWANKEEKFSFKVGDIFSVRCLGAQWRKANAIHKWFVDNCAKGVDNCEEVSVSIEKIRELFDVVRQVKVDHSRAPKLLPTCNGFFFGSTDYDDWYFEDLDYTYDVLKKIIDEAEAEPYRFDLYYSASW